MYFLYLKSENRPNGDARFIPYPGLRFSVSDAAYPWLWPLSPSIHLDHNALQQKLESLPATKSLESFLLLGTTNIPACLSCVTGTCVQRTVGGDGVAEIVCVWRGGESRGHVACAASAPPACCTRQTFYSFPVCHAAFHSLLPPHPHPFPPHHTTLSSNLSAQSSDIKRSRNASDPWQTTGSRRWLFLIIFSGNGLVGVNKP